MPNNWKTYKLGELSTLGDGAHSKVKRIDYGILYLTSKNFKDGRLKLDKIDYISENDYNRLFSSKSKAVNKPSVGDILIGIIGTLGNAYLYKEKDTFGISSSVAIIRPDHTKLDSQYLYYCITESKFKNYQNAHNGASVQGYTNLPSLRTIPINLPPLREQQAIASILSTINDKIENNLTINKTLEEMAMALYKYWFLDFGPFQDGEFVESELGMIPKGWEVKIVKDFGDVVTGKTPEKKYPEHFGDVIPFITPTDFKDYGKHIVSANRYISELGIKKLNKNILPINTVIVTCIGSDMGKVALSKIDSLTNQQINSLKTNHYLYMYCFFINNYTLLKRMAGDGTTMPIINKSSFENIKVIYPSKMVLNNFEKLINDYDEQILSNTLENQTLTQLRDTLLPQLISGDVQLKEFRETVEEVL